MHPYSKFLASVGHEQSRNDVTPLNKTAEVVALFVVHIRTPYALTVVRGLSRRNTAKLKDVLLDQCNMKSCGKMCTVRPASVPQALIMKFSVLLMTSPCKNNASASLDSITRIILHWHVYKHWLLKMTTSPYKDMRVDNYKCSLLSHSECCCRLK